MAAVPDPLESAKLRLERAEQQIRDLNESTGAFFRSRPYYTVEDRDTKPGRILHWVKLFELPPKRWMVDVTEITGHLRSPLDYSINAVASTIGTDLSKFRRLAFPFAPDQQKLEDEIKSRKIQRVSPDLADIIRASKPFHPDKGGNSLLFGLNELTKSEKHRDLSVINMAAHQWALGGGRGWRSEGEVIFGFGSWDPKEQGFILIDRSSDSKVNGEAQIALNVALGKLKGFDRQPVVQTLTQMASAVKAVLLKIEKRFFS
jgi:hypothetical protein